MQGHAGVAAAAVAVAVAVAVAILMRLEVGKQMYNVYLKKVLTTSTTITTTTWYVNPDIFKRSIYNKFPLHLTL